MEISLFKGAKRTRIILFFVSVHLTCLLYAQDKNNLLFKKKRDKVDISDLELRLRLTDYCIQLTEEVEENADKI